MGEGGIQYPFSCLLSYVSGLLSSIFDLLSSFFGLLSSIFGLLSSIFSLLSSILCLLSFVSATLALVRLDIGYRQGRIILSYYSAGYSASRLSFRYISQHKQGISAASKMW